MKRGLAYRLQNVLYVSLTNKSVVPSFLQLRGPGYRLPVSSGFAPLPDGHAVTSEEVEQVVNLANEDGAESKALAPFGTVFAGHVGDPLLEIDTLEESIDRILRTRPGMAIGILTSGAFDTDVAARLCDFRERLDIETISATVNIGGCDPRTYAAAVGDRSNFQKATGFVATLAERGFPVNCVAVHHPKVTRKMKKVARMASSLGATIFHDLPYYPETLYDVLELTEAEVTADQIKKSFHKLSMQFHPDRAAALESEAEATELLQRYEQITEAHEVLSDPERRTLYDAGVCDLSGIDYSNEKFLLTNPKTGHTNS